MVSFTQVHRKNIVKSESISAMVTIFDGYVIEFT